MTRSEVVQVHMPSWLWRTVLTVLVLLLGWIITYAYGAVQGPLEAHTAVQQLQDDPQSYAIARTWAAANLQGVVSWIEIACIGLLWGSYAIGAIRYAYAQQECNS